MSLHCRDVCAAAGVDLDAYMGNTAVVPRGERGRLYVVYVHNYCCCVDLGFEFLKKAAAFWQDKHARQSKPACTGGSDVCTHLYRREWETYVQRHRRKCSRNPILDPCMYPSSAPQVYVLVSQHSASFHAALHFDLTSCCSALLSRPSRAARRLSSADEWAVGLTLLCLALLRLSSVSDITAGFSCLDCFIQWLYRTLSLRKRGQHSETKESARNLWPALRSEWSVLPGCCNIRTGQGRPAHNSKMHSRCPRGAGYEENRRI